MPIDYIARTIMCDIECKSIKRSHNNYLEMPLSLILTFNSPDFHSTKKKKKKTERLWYTT